MSGILKGMRVVEGSAFVAVPLAGMTLAQMGAEVIRFDRIGKSGNALYGAYGQDFTCACGTRVMVIGLTRRQRKGLLKVTGTGAQMQALAKAKGRDLNDEGVRWELRHEITDILRPWFAARRVADFAAEFDRGGLTWSVFRTVREALAQDADLSEDNPMFRTLTQPGLGRFELPGHPARFSAHARQDPQAAPALGAQTEEVLGDVVGLSDTEISQLFDRGVVQSPRFSVRPAA
ncbi:formyl-coenzyme A transferase [Roseovarius gaetbuli]|uniref:Formyl-coenzyme A transferase n=1 Tax=Roseovarius gaetbuli TaxID=1356575 RepID=A0A1X6ZX59_9RHOB|nr:CoA transferase [Roseovarius gaetbuli]SLN64181.1 formyl-coenzyme A transferase [Roseovarius gaetbuli]